MSERKLHVQFPSELITEILTRLPVKSICRLKCVSKTWNSKICNSKFINSYISRNSSSSTSSWVIVDRIVTESEEVVTHFNPAENPNVCLLSVNVHRLIYEPITSDWISAKSPPVILSSSNGLLLVNLGVERDPYKEHEKNPSYFSQRRTEEVLFVINPITGEWVPLPKPRKLINKLNSVGFISRLDDSCGGVVEKFLVVEYRPLIGSDSATLLCFSSDTGK
ncbi:F-box protein At3g26010-like [Spinacia oleracea]|uniref:F-box protein At3g26010-like n=1 Tax=Spinacia oleracea TaxID=3562 RepID=A0A9R0JGT1_SPIOL|nr:F-box protein At3g26010-like [Spinacia oleracea]